MRDIFLDEKKQGSVNRELSGILLALFVSPANRSTLWLPFRFASLKLCLQRQASVLCFFYLIFPLPFFVIFWSSVCSCCRCVTVFFYPFFFGVECNKIFPYFGFFLSQGFFLSFVCLEFSTSVVVVVVVVASCLDLFQTVFVCVAFDAVVNSKSLKSELLLFVEQKVN